MLKIKQRNIVEEELKYDSGVNAMAKLQKHDIYHRPF